MQDKLIAANPHGKGALLDEALRSALSRLTGEADVAPPAGSDKVREHSSTRGGTKDRSDNTGIIVHYSSFILRLFSSVTPPPCQALRYIRDRVNVPRDMSIWAGKRLRQALEDTAALAGSAQGPPIPTQHRRDQDPRAFR